MVLRAVIIWILLAAVAVANGVFRNALVTPRLGEQRAHLLSTGMLCILIFALTLAFIKWIGARTALEASLTGLLWVGLTLTFEFLAGHFAFGHSWQKLLADYNIRQGRVWIVVPIVTYLSPRWALLLRGLAR